MLTDFRRAFDSFVGFRAAALLLSSYFSDSPLTFLCFIIVMEQAATAGAITYADDTTLKYVGSPQTAKERNWSDPAEQVNGCTK